MSSGGPIAGSVWPEDARPVVSVFVTTFNHERYIGTCLNGILRQVVDFPVEIIVLDDASTDRTPKLLRKTQQLFPHLVKPILMTENQWSRNVKARPRMHESARGEYIANCDGDDFWTDPLKLAKQVACLRAHPECVLSFHNAVEVDESGTRILRWQLTKQAQHDYTARELRTLKWGGMLVGTMVYRNVRLEFPPEYHLAPNGDNFLPVLLAEHGGAKYEGDVVKPLAYRQHAQGMWSEQPRSQRDRMHAQTWLQIAAYLVRIGDTDAARDVMRRRLPAMVARYLESTN